MTQDEQVIAAMKQNGGYATLGQLYQKVDVSNWGTKTPFASIRRIVQKNAAFFRIRAGLWALEEFRNKLPSAILPPQMQHQQKKKRPPIIIIRVCLWNWATWKIKQPMSQPKTRIAHS